MRPAKLAHYDYEYACQWTCNLFLFLQPLASWRQVKVTRRRTKQDFAHCVYELAHVLFQDAKKIRVVLDNLNTHTPAALYKTVPPEHARLLVSQLKFHYTPKHSSWLNMAEIEISVLAGHCLDRCLGHIEMVKQEVAAWQVERNEGQATIVWRFSVTKARDKLKRLYPIH